MSGSTDTDEVCFELWVGGYHCASFDTLREAERGAAERPPTEWGEVVEMPAGEDPWRPGDGEPSGDVVRQYPEVVR